MTFQGAASALGASPKASGLLLAFSCPLTRPAWPWPDLSLAPEGSRAKECTPECANPLDVESRLYTQVFVRSPILLKDNPRQATGRLSYFGSLDLTSVINLEALCAMSCPRSASLLASSGSTALGGSLSGLFGEIVRL